MRRAQVIQNLPEDRGDDLGLALAALGLPFDRHPGLEEVRLDVVREILVVHELEERVASLKLPHDPERVLLLLLPGPGVERPLPYAPVLDGVLPLEVLGSVERAAVGRDGVGARPLQPRVGPDLSLAVVLALLQHVLLAVRHAGGPVHHAEAALAQLVADDEIVDGVPLLPEQRAEDVVVHEAAQDAGGDGEVEG